MEHNDGCSGVFRMSIDDINEEVLFGCENKQGVEFKELETDSGHIEDNVREVEPNSIYIHSMFGDEEETYEAYNSYTLLKGFGICKSKITTSIMDQKVIRRRFVCNKEGHKIHDKRSEGKTVLHP